MSRKTAIHVGDLVRFRFGTRNVTGTVKEDRGPIGIKGRHLYLIYFVRDPVFPDHSQIELPAEELEVVRDPSHHES